MTKIAFIGAGSFGFTRKLIKDVLTFPLLQASTLSLMDVNPERLDFAKRAAERLVREMGVSARVEATMDRREALEGADAVLCTILAGGVDVWRHDIQIPKKYGIDTNVGDTRGPSGIFRALRTIPVMLDIAATWSGTRPARSCSTTPTPWPCSAGPSSAASSIPTTGLCHCVQGTAEMLAGWIGAPMDEITYTCAGINHQAWYLRYEWNGQDAYPAHPRGGPARPRSTTKRSCATRCSCTWTTTSPSPAGTTPSTTRGSASAPT